jgi:selenophosphate synthetase-related protein
MPQIPSLTIDQWIDGGATADTVRRVRDLLIVDGGSYRLVIACDSNGSVGDKPHDHVAWPPHDTGFVAAKVPLMEVIAVGAEPLILVNNLCVEMNPTGREILNGIEHACSVLTRPPIITGSDETNMPTVQTGVGVTVIAVSRPEALRVGRSRAGDVVYAIGTPLGPVNGVGAAYEETADNVCSLSTVLTLVKMEAVREVLPVGSKGLAYEFGQLAQVAGLTPGWIKDPGIDMQRSGGACAVVLASVAADYDMPATVGAVPVTKVGWLS